MNIQHARARWGLILLLAASLAAPQAAAAVVKKKRASPAQVSKAKAKVKATTPRKAETAAPKEAPPSVVVLTVEGDKGGKLRAQLESSLRRSRQAKVASLKQYGAIGKQGGLKGPVVFTEAPLAKAAPKMKLDGAVTGRVEGASLSLRVLDASGAVVSDESFQLTRGKLSTADANAAALAISNALRAPPPTVFESPSSVTPSEPLEPATPVAEAPVKPVPAPPAPPSVEAPKPQAPTTVAERPAEAPRPLPPEPPKPVEPVKEPPKPRPSEALAIAPQPKDGPPPMEEEPESHTTTDPFLAVGVDTGSGGTVGSEPVRPPIARLTVGGTTTWRRYCARPGVKSCGEFDKKPEAEQLGDRSDYDSSVPYLGISAELELLPLARSTSAVRGLGAVLGYRRGYASTNVTLYNEVGQGGTHEVVATDSVLTAQAMYRYYFGRGDSRASLGYAGVRAGLLTRSFDVDESAESPLSGTHRLFPSAGLEVSVPLMRWVRLEGAGQIFISPKPGTGFSDEGGELKLEVSDYGTAVSTFGWEAELGASGEIWGPFGYSVRFKLSRFKDTFTGAGARLGWENGGVAEDTYSSIHWGITASY
ncbi:hypothetical protein LZ198_15875 [Myxococcus sp. K15C18031901]|uniref:hypothetical protein n=1 Tax=Myxococcus dinghuensis TaxID=2906761 RepID=UPI0020A7B7A4|nr:hypothetical protein [Myxococcus dinghuensis]MCP3100347.1 hypothetical protein [Myxococcus dinghuensis]